MKRIIVFFVRLFIFASLLCVAVSAAESDFKPIWPIPSCTHIGSLDKYSSGTLHGGIDIPTGELGKNVLAVANGTVTSVKNECKHISAKCDCGGGWGNYITIKHTVNGVVYYSRYAHLTLNSIKVKKGDAVASGQLIGLSGSSGQSSGPHLHLELFTGNDERYNRSFTFKYYINHLEAIDGITIAKHNIDSSVHFKTWIAENCELINDRYVFTYCRHLSYSSIGLCTSCGVEYEIPEPTMAPIIYTNKAWLGGLTKITVYDKPYKQGCNSVKVSSKGKFLFLGYTENASGEKWCVIGNPGVEGYYQYITTGDFEKLEKEESYEPKITFSEDIKSPEGVHKKGDAFPLSGTIKSEDFPLKYVSVRVVSIATGEDTLSKTVEVKGTSFDLKDIGNYIKFGNLPTSNAGYYMIITVIDYANGVTVKEYDPFTVGAAALSPSTVPSIAVKNVLGGIEVNISCSDKNATIHYSIDGKNYSTVSAASGAVFTLKVEGAYAVKAYTSCTDHTQSSTVSKTGFVSRAIAPSIIETSYGKKPLASGGSVPMALSVAAEEETLTMLASSNISDPTYFENAAYIEIAGEGVIYYTLDGSSPTTNSDTYTGAIEIYENCTVKAMCVTTGAAPSDVAEKDIVLASPAAPSIKVTTEKIAVKESATVTWEPVATATRYTATLYNANGTVVETKTITGHAIGFELSSAGTYTISVVASNVAGDSVASNIVTVNAMPDATVRFLDYNGKELSVHTVRYGGTATQPQVPTRKGHTFVGWNKNVFGVITEDTDFTAQYQKNKYTVSFYNGEGILVGTPQRIEYEGAATPPTVSELKVPDGYVFAGWCIENDSEGLDYTCVTADMKVTASYQWGNKNLPVTLKFESAVYDVGTAGPFYTCKIGIKNTNAQFTKGRLLLVLQTKDGRTITTVVKDIAMPAATNTDYTTEEVIINSAEVGTIVKAVVLGLDSDNGDKTGGTCSAMVSGSVTPKVTYSAYTGWSTSTPPASAVNVQSKVQYRYRAKEYKTEKNLPWDSTWTQYNMTTTYGDWSGWSKTVATASSTQQVETRQIAATYKTQYRYFRYYGKLNAAGQNKTGYGSTIIWSHFCPDWCKSYMVSYSYGVTPWLDNKLTATKSHSCTCCGLASHSHYKYNNVTYYAPTSKGYHESRQVEVTPAYTEYRYRTITTTRYYWRWGAYTSWLDTAPSAYSGNYDEYQSQTLYRYQTKTTGASPVETPNTTETYSHSGSIGSQFTGKKATILVYKKTNTDPTQSQLEYVEQVTLNSTGGYSVTVKAKEKLDYEGTGDFVIALAVEGASRLVNMGVIEAPRPKYSVKLIVNGETVSTQEVALGASVTVPEFTVPAGYRFVGWDDSLANVSSNLNINAILEPLVYTVTLVDFENATVSMKKVVHGEAIPIPEDAPTADGMTFIGWDKLMDGVYTVTEDMLVTAEWEQQTYTVRFEDGQGGIVEEQTVAYGNAATLPETYAAGDILGEYVFAGWNNDSAWWNVTTNIAVQPILLSENTLVAPMASIEDGETISPDFLELYPTEEGAKIYYATDVVLLDEDIYTFLGIDSSNNEGDVEAVSVVDDSGEGEVDTYIQIYEYTEPILLDTTMLISTFQVTSDNVVSGVANYFYIVDDTAEIPVAGFGDANNDGVIDTRDITRILNYVVGTTDVANWIYSDANGDTEISALDALRVMKYLAGWSVELGQ